MLSIRNMLLFLLSLVIVNLNVDETAEEIVNVVIKDPTFMVSNCGRYTKLKSRSNLINFCCWFILLEMMICVVTVSFNSGSFMLWTLT